MEFTRKNSKTTMAILKRYVKPAFEDTPRRVLVVRDDWPAFKTVEELKEEDEFVNPYYDPILCGMVAQKKMITVSQLPSYPLPSYPLPSAPSAPLPSAPSAPLPSATPLVDYTILVGIKPEPKAE